MEFDVESAMKFIICANARSGSTYLCELLHATGAVPQIDELGYYGGTGFVERAVRETPPWKLLGAHVEKLLSSCYLACDFPDYRFIYLVRHDTISRAISSFKAEAGAGFTSFHSGRTGLHYNSNAIDFWVLQHGRWDSMWHNFFRGTEALCVSYEQLVQSPDSVVASVLDYLELGPAEIDMSAVQLRKQADEQSVLWRQWYLEHGWEHSSLHSFLDLVSDELPMLLLWHHAPTGALEMFHRHVLDSFSCGWRGYVRDSLAFSAEARVETLSFHDALPIVDLLHVPASANIDELVSQCRPKWLLIRDGAHQVAGYRERSCLLPSTLHLVRD